MKVFFIVLLAFTFGSALAQGSDFILLKKNSHTLKTYYTGQPISLGTASGAYSGIISSIQKDSLYLTQYDIRQVPTNLGVYVVDTVSVYKLKFNYHDILYIGHRSSGFNWSGTGASLFGGGLLLTTVGLGTWLFAKPGTRYYAPPALIIGSATLGGIGYLLLTSKNSFKLGSKYQLEYVRLSNGKK